MPGGGKNKATESAKTMITKYNINEDLKESIKENILRVGKLDVTKIERRKEEFQTMKEESKLNKVSNKPIIS